MPALTQPLRDEHAEILPRIHELREVADAVGQLSPDALRKEMTRAHRFLAGHLIAHAHAEETALYPMVGEVCGAVEATATMSREHEMIGDLVAELGTVRERLEATGANDDLERDLRRLLYGIHAVVGAHFAKEVWHCVAISAGLQPAKSLVAPDFAHRLLRISPTSTQRSS